jgi:sulfur relay protein TusB/DsrH
MMAILHIVANHLAVDALTTLVERSDANDGYVFMDDGVYVLLGKGLLALGSRDVFVLAGHVDERGLKRISSDNVTLINMSGLVRLTASYTSSMSW